MRALALWLGLLLAGCGTLVDTLEDGGATGQLADGGGVGLSCAADDPCTCTACTSGDQCAVGLSCVVARRKGQNCADSRQVCLTGP